MCIQICFLDVLTVVSFYKSGDSGHKYFARYGPLLQIMLHIVLEIFILSILSDKIYMNNI